MEEILNKINQIQQAFDMLLEICKGGPGSGPHKPSGPLTDPHGQGPIHVPARAKPTMPALDDERLVSTPGKPIRLR